MTASLHSPYSDPGRFASLLRELGTDIERIAEAARNVIGHYRAEMPDLPSDRWGEIDLRWIERILATDQERHGTSLDEPRTPAERVAGCCRDHSLFTVAALREQGIPARNRVGFAGYFIDGYHADHVIVEYRGADGGWILTDPELAAGSHPFDVRDMTAGLGQPFETAAQVWLASRSGDLDASTYGVFPGSELSGEGFVGAYVVYEMAHRYGDELLLWDDWSDPERPLAPDELDDLARLLVEAYGDADADRRLYDRYRHDPRLHPRETVTRYSPYGRPPVAERLVR